METQKVPIDDDTLLFTDIFNETEFGSEDLFSILENFNNFPPIINEQNSKTTSSTTLQDFETEVAETSQKCKRQKIVPSSIEEPNNNNNDGQPRMSHIAVERNRRKLMNDQLSILKSLMPCFYVKRGDQASIVEGVIDYINELHQLVQCLESKKQRKVYNEVLSPKLLISSPRPSPLISPRTILPISPRTPHSQQWLQQCGGYLSSEPSPTSSASSINDNINELVANSKSSVADVEVKFCGSHLLLKTVSSRIPGQALRIMSVLEDLALEIVHASVNTADETMLNSFTIKIGIECQLSAEELAQQIQQTFC
ncbi:transcription factor SPEECHLESS [Trifolium repens]|nr:transcription factor SPEECHLESS [Trifolium repens]